MAKVNISFEIDSRDARRIAALVDALKVDVEALEDYSEPVLEAIRSTVFCLQDTGFEDLISDNGLKYIDQTIGLLQQIKAKAIEARAQQGE